MRRHITRWTAIAALTIFGAVAALAADATGKWTWTTNINGNEVKQTLELKQDGEKLTGTLTRNDMKTEISEGKIKGQDLSFVVSRERNGQTVKITYKGKLDADTIKGTTTFNDQSRDWTANRVK